MGLDFEGSKAHWSYGNFKRFRCRLALEIGIDLDQMAGFAEKDGISWKDFTDPIIPLLNHSDCDGQLSPIECARIAPRLRQLIARWDDGYDKRQAILLAEGMESCTEAGKPLFFC